MPNLIPFNRAATAGGGAPGSDIVFTDNADFAPSASAFIKPNTVYVFELYEESYGSNGTYSYLDGDNTVTTNVGRQRVVTATNTVWIAQGSGRDILFKLDLDGSTVYQKATADSAGIAGAVGKDNSGHYQAIGIVVSTSATGGVLTGFSVSINGVSGGGANSVVCICKEVQTTTITAAQSCGAGKVIAVARGHAISSTGWYFFDNFQDVSDKVWIDQYWRYTVRLGVDTDPGASIYVQALLGASTGQNRYKSTDFGAWSSNGSDVSNLHSVTVDGGTVVSSISSQTATTNFGNTGAGLANFGWQFVSGEKCGVLDDIDMDIGTITAGGLSDVRAELVLSAPNYLLGYTTAGIAMTSSGTKTFTNWVSAHTTAEVSGGSVHCRPYLEQGADYHFTAECNPWPAADNRSDLRVGTQSGADTFYRDNGGSWTTISNQSVWHDFRTPTKLSAMAAGYQTSAANPLGTLASTAQRGMGGTLDTGAGTAMNGPVGMMRVSVPSVNNGGAQDVFVEVRAGETAGSGDLVAKTTGHDLASAAVFDLTGWVGTQSVLYIYGDAEAGYTVDRSASAISSTNATIDRIEWSHNSADSKPGMPDEVFADATPLGTFQGSSDDGDRYFWAKVVFSPTTAGSPCSVDEITIATVSV